MSFFSKFFSKKQLETIEILKNQFIDLTKKSQSDFLSLVGITGRMKGLDIISTLGEKSEYSVKDVKRFNAKLTEYYIRYQSLSLFGKDSNKFLQKISYEFSKELGFHILPIDGSNQFVITTLTKNIDKIEKELINIRVNLFKLNQERKN
jgi:hypothetical protein